MAEKDIAGSRATGWHRRRFGVIAVWASALMSPSDLVAQQTPAPAHPTRVGTPTGSRGLAYLGGNAALGGLVAGLLRGWRGDWSWTAFRDGSIGGAIAYAGRRVSVERFAGAGLVGREVAAIGASVVRNTAEGVGPLDELVLPLWLGRVYLHREGDGWGTRAAVKLDVPTTLAAAYFGLRRDASVDWGASLSSGTPVFVTLDADEDDGWLGYQAAGAIWLRGDPADAYPETAREPVLGHERAHVLQYDFLGWGVPSDRLLNERLPGGTWTARHLDLGLHGAAWSLANLLIPYPSRPWELEANYLSGVSPHR